MKHLPKSSKSNCDDANRIRSSKQLTKRWQDMYRTMRLDLQDMPAQGRCHRDTANSGSIQASARRMRQETAHGTTLTSRSHHHVPTAQEEETGTRRTEEKEAARTEERKATRIKEREQDQAPNVHRVSHLEKFAGTISRARARKAINASTAIHNRVVIGKRVTANGRRNVDTHIG